MGGGRHPVEGPGCALCVERVSRNGGRSGSGSRREGSKTTVVMCERFDRVSGNVVQNLFVKKKIDQTTQESLSKTLLRARKLTIVCGIQCVPPHQSSALGVTVLFCLPLPVCCPPVCQSITQMRSQQQEAEALPLLPRQRMAWHGMAATQQQRLCRASAI